MLSATLHTLPGWPPRPISLAARRAFARPGHRRGQGPLGPERHPPRPVRQDAGPGRGPGRRGSRRPARRHAGSPPAAGRGRGALGRGAGVRGVAAATAARARGARPDPGCPAGARLGSPVAGDTDPLSRPARARRAQRDGGTRRQCAGPEGHSRFASVALARRSHRARQRHRARLPAPRQGAHETKSISGTNEPSAPLRNHHERRRLAALTLQWDPMAA